MALPIPIPNNSKTSENSPFHQRISSSTGRIFWNEVMKINANMIKVKPIRNIGNFDFIIFILFGIFAI